MNEGDVMEAEVAAVDTERDYGDAEAKSPPLKSGPKRGAVVVRPRFIVPDTNAFIDHLEALQKSVQSNRFNWLVSTVGMYFRIP